MAKPDADDGYILGRTAAEYTRLRMQAKFWEPATLEVLRGAGLAKGMRCLDAGCGPGEAMRLMVRIVGPGGHVTGLDLDAALGTHMLAELRREEGPHFDFTSCDLMRGDPVPGATAHFFATTAHVALGKVALTGPQYGRTVVRAAPSPSDRPRPPWPPPDSGDAVTAQEAEAAAHDPAAHLGR